MRASKPGAALDAAGANARCSWASEMARLDVICKAHFARISFRSSSCIVDNGLSIFRRTCDCASAGAAPAGVAPAPPPANGTIVNYRVRSSTPLGGFRCEL